uniref:Uncharacterized protein n=1 Tax=Octopus bimaculoides TaxID=37653 RepID=A0A0L8HZ71_OCTBM
MPPKKYKIEDECRAFNEEWIHKYFFNSSKNKLMCLLCQERTVMLKCNKPFSDGELIKQCMMDCASVVCLEMKGKFKNISLLRRTVMQRIEIISEEMTQQLRDASKDFACYSLAVDESTNIQDTAQLQIFVRGVDENFHITKELLSLESMKNTTTSQDLYECVVNAIEKSALSWDRLTSITTNGAWALHGNFAARSFSIFGSTYICEWSFSCMKINKSKNRSMVSDTNLKSFCQTLKEL